MVWSFIVAREAVANATYEKRFRHLPSANLTRKVWVHIIIASCLTRWARRTRSLRDRYHPPTVCLETQGELHVAVPAVSTLQVVRQEETEEWGKAAEKKSSMTAYMTGKRDIAREGFFDNSRGRGLLAEARSAWHATFSILEGSLYRAADAMHHLQSSRGDDQAHSYSVSGYSPALRDNITADCTRFCRKRGPAWKHVPEDKWKLPSNGWNTGAGTERRDDVSKSRGVSVVVRTVVLFSFFFSCSGYVAHGVQSTEWRRSLGACCALTLRVVSIASCEALDKRSCERCICFEGLVSKDEAFAAPSPEVGGSFLDGGTALATTAEGTDGVTAGSLRVCQTAAGGRRGAAP
ncbi:hypothetical protein HPB51_021650 [Rhipicephalus microplus]|uniref:Uncharacterized protein n=1 Tax=Rhipicephalus microplus TaxID=6941 RepID=A0A9J6EV67_RHIMP|nr:hypothetical protein HPB51_021650 [Rhipicephalus microplus]